VERFGRSSFGFGGVDPRALFFPTVQDKTDLTGFPNRSDRFRPVGCRERSSSKEVFATPWLRLFRCGKAFEVFGVFGEFLDRIGPTGLPNRSDRFPLPA
jgi:hypothetical protein